MAYQSNVVAKGQGVASEKGLPAWWDLIHRLQAGERIDPRSYRRESGISWAGVQRRLLLVSGLPNLPVVRDLEGRYVLIYYVHDDDIMCEE